MAPVIRLTLPYPVSANRYWRSFVPRGHKRAVTIVSKDAKAYRSVCGLEAKQAGVRCTDGLVELRMTLVPKNVVCMDLDNALKVVIDALKGVVYADDKQVRRIVAERADADGTGRMDVEVIEFIPSAPPLFAEAAS